ncbi:chemotaxis protein CheW [Xylophilus rhododendri]|uniref:Chemotaxis protein CheW n=1 Tax=Xylophilus rhododendri TaxID=2697032 RepID=A0A857J372_9BURK|nr:chemotaxis protein CheW [Xylophilus rhododendri]QHI97502.1 chemotaxis protein CheW [Xylophilus rhododendri]
MPEASHSAPARARRGSPHAAHDRAEAPAEALSEGRQYLTFTLHQAMYAVAILAVREIIEYGSPTVVPMMPAAVRGVINLRGAVVPVVDLQVRFGGQPAAPGKRTCIVIVEASGGQEGQRQVMGMVVDSVSEVLDIPDTDIEPAPTFGTQIRGDFIEGMGKVRGRFVIVLDIERVLALDELGMPAVQAEPASGTGG